MAAARATTKPTTGRDLSAEVVFLTPANTTRSDSTPSVA
jgi:hypothetical protein